MTKEENINIVNNAAIFMDERKPGWENEVDLTILNVADPFQCVLGQLYGSFNTGRHILGVGLGEELSLAFAGKRTEYWIQEILERRRIEVPEREKELVIA